MKLKIATLVSGITLLSACSTVPEAIEPQEIVSISTFFQTNYWLLKGVWYSCQI